MDLKQIINKTENVRDNTWQLYQDLEEQIELLGYLCDDAITSAIIDQLGCKDANELLGTFKDVCRGGANAGFHGFIYSQDMLQFFRDNRAEILELLKEQAELAGESGVLELILSFNCLKDSEIDIDQIGAVIFGNSEDSQVIDALCWFTLETLAFRVDR